MQISIASTAWLHTDSHGNPHFIGLNRIARHCIALHQNKHMQVHKVCTHTHTSTLQPFVRWHAWCTCTRSRACGFIMFHRILSCSASLVSSFALDFWIVWLGWGGVVTIITPDEIITKKLKGRTDPRSQCYATSMVARARSEINCLSHCVTCGVWGMD